MKSFDYFRPNSLIEAAQYLEAHPGSRLLAGGQSLLAAMKLDLSAPRALIDLGALLDLKEIKLDADTLWIGAMCTHQQIASSPTVQKFCAMLAKCAAGIGDQQIRHVGTIGGSLANNDPAACWPAAVLAANALIVTNQRSIRADDFFKAVYVVALAVDEIIIGIRFDPIAAAHYIKFEQPASRFALVAVAVVKTTSAVRVAVTGLGHGVRRWPEAEAQLNQQFSVDALSQTELDASHALADLHATARYRAHLAGVLTRRAVAHINGEPQPRPLQKIRSKIDSAKIKDTVASASSNDTPAPLNAPQFSGQQRLSHSVERVWTALLDPQVLRDCIPGCESFSETKPNHFIAIVKIGIGPVSARFTANIALLDISPPNACTIQFEGQGGAIGFGSGLAQVRLSGDNLLTQLDWQANTQVGGKIAQLGTRLIEASTVQLINEFFNRFGRTITSDGALPLSPLGPTVSRLSPINRLFGWIKSKLSKFSKIQSSTNGKK